MKSCFQVAFVVFFGLMSFGLIPESANASTQMPDSTYAYSYAAAISPYATSFPGDARPLGVGSVAGGGDTLALRAALDEYSGAVDVYVAASTPIPGAEFLVFTEAGGILVFTGMESLSPWRSAVRGFLAETVLPDIPAFLLPGGQYTFFVLVAPAGVKDFSRFHLWSSSVTIPGAEPVCSTGSCTVGSDGGVVSSVDGAVTLTIPAAALSSNTSITIQQAGNGGANVVAGTYYSLGPDGTTFSLPARLTFSYDPGNVTSGDPSKLRVYRMNKGTWEPLVTTVDTTARTVSAWITGFSEYGVMDVALVPLTASFSRVVLGGLGNLRPFASATIPTLTGFDFQQDGIDGSFPEYNSCTYPILSGGTELSGRGTIDVEALSGAQRGTMSVAYDFTPFDDIFSLAFWGTAHASPHVGNPVVNQFLQDWAGEQFDITSADGDLGDPTISLTIENPGHETFYVTVTWEMMGDTVGMETSAGAAVTYSIYLCEDVIAVAEGSELFEVQNGERFLDLSGKGHLVQGEEHVQVDLRPLGLAAASGGYGNPGGSAEVLGDIWVEILPVVGD